MLVILAKLTSSAILGDFSLALAISSPPIHYATALRGMQASDVKEEHSFQEYMLIRGMILASALALILLFCFLAQYPLEQTLIVFIVAISKVFDSLSDGIYGLLQQKEQMNRISISRMIQGISQLVVMALLLITTHQLIWSVLGLAIMSGMVTIMYDIRSASQILSETSSGEFRRQWLVTRAAVFSWDGIKSLAIAMIPLGLVTMLIPLQNSIPRYFLAQSCGKSELGVFSAISYLMVAGGTVVGALGSSTLPRMSKLYSSGNRLAFTKLLKKTLAIVCLLGLLFVLIAAVAGRQILLLLYTAEYAQYTREFVGLAIVATLTYACSILAYSLTATRFFKQQLPILVIVSLTSLVTSIYLIPKYRLMGGVLSVAIFPSVYLIISFGVLLLALKKIPQQTNQPI
jgi:O-antigen/teichoic acid export membrane protein